jgi:3-deoxy-D-manno-octulosonic-acid transferase
LVERIHPDLFILVKYDFWPNLLNVLYQKEIPVCLISARFRQDQYLFKRWGRVFLNQIRNFRWIFVQDEASAILLKKQGCEQVMVAGDTRVDAVMNRGDRTGGTVTGEHRNQVIIGGSTWPPEERMLADLWQSDDFKELGESWRLVIAPHDISEDHLRQIEELFAGRIIRYSRCQDPLNEVLIKNMVVLIDSIGQLSSLYASADLAVIGGGFGKGIHNILEPAAYGLPVVIGPNWTKFREAASLIDIGAAFPVSSFESFSTIVKKLCLDPEFRCGSGILAVSYMKSQMGSSDLIIRCLLEKW